MALFELAVNKTLDNEGGFFNNRKTGEVVNFGITVWFLRNIGALPPQKQRAATPAEIAYVKGMTRTFAVSLYRHEVWNPLHLDLVINQDVADKVFDLAVNMGPGDHEHPGAITILQHVLGVDADGIIGPKTIAAINLVDPVTLLAEYRAAIEARYREIAEKNPVHEADLPGWLNRLAA